MKRPSLVVASIVLLAATASAQKMLVPGGKGQTVQLHDAAEWLELASSSVAPEQRATKKAELLTGMAGFARAFIKPSLAKGEDITPLADRYLVAIGSPEQQAWLARLLHRHLKNVVYETDLEIRQFALSAKDYKAIVAPLEAELVEEQAGDLGSRHAVLSSAHADALVKQLDDTKGVEKVGASHALVGAMSRADVMLGTERSYVKDYNVEILSHKAEALPVHATIFDGLRGRAFCGRLGNRRLGVAIDLTYTEVEKPMATFETDLGGKKLVIDLPSSTSVRLRRNLILPDLRAADLKIHQLPGRDAALCSFPFKGRHLVFVVRAGATR